MKANGIPMPNEMQQFHMERLVRVIRTRIPRRFTIVAHSRPLHPDDFTATALMIRILSEYGHKVAGIVRVPTDQRFVETVSQLGGDVVALDIGANTQYWQTPPPNLYILDHHIQGTDVSQLPSTLGLVVHLMDMLGLHVTQEWLEAMTIVDRFDAMGPIRAREAGYGAWRGLPWEYYVFLGISERAEDTPKQWEYAIMRDLASAVFTARPQPSDVLYAAAEFARASTQLVDASLPIPLFRALTTLAETMSYDEARRHTSVFGVDILTVALPYMPQSTFAVLAHFYADYLRSLEQLYRAAEKAERINVCGNIDVVFVEGSGQSVQVFEMLKAAGKVVESDPVVVAYINPRGGGWALWRHDAVRHVIDLRVLRGAQGVRFVHENGFFAATDFSRKEDVVALLKQRLCQS